MDVEDAGVLERFAETGFELRYTRVVSEEDAFAFGKTSSMKA